MKGQLDQNYQQGYNQNQQGFTQDQQYYYDQQQQQQQTQGGTDVPLPTGARPFVDPNAAGEVDPNAYPEPQESTHKIRGRYDILEKLFSNTKQELIFAKAFYFFFFSAFGSLFPLMAIYFKQMALNPGQTGILIGIRPFIEMISTPFWGSLAHKLQKGKLMLICALGSWIVFTMAIGFINPPPIACVIYKDNNYILKDIDEKALTKRSVDPMEYYRGLSKTTLLPEVNVNSAPVLPHLYHKRSVSSIGHQRYRRDIPLPPSHVVGQSPSTLHYTINFKNYSEAESWISPPFSSIVYKESGVQKVFFLLLLLVLLGEFVSCPAIMLADTAVLQYLSDEADHYGSQRMFGSLGWGLTMFILGIALDRSTEFPGHPCVPHDKERNYIICFAVFSCLMGCALLIATQFKFDHSETVTNVIPMDEVKKPEDNGPRPWNEPKIPMHNPKTGRQQLEDAIGSIKTRIFANTMKETPEWMMVFREFKTLRCSAFLFVAWWMGFGVGLIFAFLFWHLQDFGGTPTLFGIASVINHISEICAYFYSFRLISQFGHIKILCLGLLCNVLRFIYISLIQNPWWVLPFEFVQGITHATVWAACCSYIAHNTKVELRGSAQGVLQGLHHGIGKGSGAIFGGLLIYLLGTQIVFRIYGTVTFFVLAGFIFIYFYRKDVGFQHDLPPEEDPRQMVEEGTALAPHGVPSNPMIPKAHSSQKLNEDQSGSYGTYSNNGNLGQGQPPTNPFMPGGENPQGTYQYQEIDNIKLFEENIFKFKPNEENTGNVFNPKGSPIKSPKSNLDYESLKKTFQAYNALYKNMDEGSYKYSTESVFREGSTNRSYNPFIY